MTDEAHCGGCGKMCGDEQDCFGGQCVQTPCDLLCNNPEQATLAEDGYRMEPLGLGGHCYEVYDYEPTETERRVVCWEFSGNRQLRVTGTPTACLVDDGVALGEPRAGGYCIQVSPGGANFAGVLLPTR
jgi:hypothetical protein